jgi:NADPH:quinone reductase-like Zn-dependent oxidoreductase
VPAETEAARAVGITKPGGVEVLRVVERPVRAPARGEVRLRVRAAAVNPTDLLLRSGGVEGLDPPWVAGMDAAGTIEAVGEGVEGLELGEPVMAAVLARRPEGGAQSELIVVQASSVVPLPDGATIEQSATLPMNGLTALLALDMLGLQTDQTLAVSGGAGFLASLAIPLAKVRGLRVLTDAKEGDEKLVASYGADVVVRRGDDFAAAILAEAPGGVDGLIDTALLGRPAFSAVRPGGGVAAVRRGFIADGAEVEVHDVSVSTVLGRTDWLRELRRHAADGRLPLRVVSSYPPERAADAHLAMAAGGLRGRVLIAF